MEITLLKSLHNVRKINLNTDPKLGKRLLSPVWQIPCSPSRSSRPWVGCGAAWTAQTQTFCHSSAAPALQAADSLNSRSRSPHSYRLFKDPNLHSFWWVDQDSGISKTKCQKFPNSEQPDVIIFSWDLPLKIQSRYPDRMVVITCLVILFFSTDSYSVLINDMWFNSLSDQGTVKKYF